MTYEEHAQHAFYVRVPMGPRASWTDFLLTQLAYFQSSPGPDLAPGLKMPEGMPIDREARSITGFVFAEHPAIPEGMLVLGVD